MIALLYPELAAAVLVGEGQAPVVAYFPHVLKAEPLILVPKGFLDEETWSFVHSGDVDGHNVVRVTGITRGNVESKSWIRGPGRRYVGHCSRLGEGIHGRLRA
jgi:hypothetical protein